MTEPETTTVAPRQRGRIKLFLGYASGVGKTYTMLAEALRRRDEHHQDIVVGYIETHGRPDTDAQVGSMEVLKRRSTEYRGYFFEELDVERVIERNPTWVLIDDMAHCNAPGSRHARRYQDIAQIVEHGINVLTALNVQHIESLGDAVTGITGIRIRDTVPDTVIREIDEIVDVDVTPRALINRLNRGDIFPKDKTPLAVASFFTEGNLSALRELALREVALAAEASVQKFRHDRGISEIWQTTERVMVCMTPGKPADKLLRRGWRVANMLHADLVAVVVKPAETAPNHHPIETANRKLAAELEIRVEQIQGRHVAPALAQYALRNQITEIVIGHARSSRLNQIVHGSTASQLIALIGGIDVLVIATPGP